MCMLDRTRRRLAATILAGAALAFAGAADAADGVGPAPHYGFGTTPNEPELARFFAIPPDGRGLPPGRGTAAEGAKVYAETCASCHGEKLEGIPRPGVGGDKLIGGRGTLAGEAPVKTIESYWPYATTVFDYVKRAMPFSAPGSLSDDQVYGVVAYILAQAKIIQPTDVMDKESLPRVRMPNRDGFVPDPRPEIELYR
jgi:S-disulfanyl-L-cysteine oxidoreductase SoxD